MAPKGIGAAAKAVAKGRGRGGGGRRAGRKPSAVNSAGGVDRRTGIEIWAPED